MKRKIIGVFIAMALVVVGYILWDSKEVDTVSEDRKMNKEEDLPLQEEELEQNEPQQAKPVVSDITKIDLYYLGKTIHYESLHESQQVAVDFMRDFINTVGYESEQQHFDEKIRPYLEEGFDSFSQLMGSEYLLPFEANRKIKSIDIVGEQESKVGYYVFMEVTYNGGEMYGVPLGVVKDSYAVLGYSEKYHEVIEAIKSYERP